MSPRLSPKAKADLDGIWDFTEAKWGPDKAEDYARQLQRAVETLASDPRRGRRCDDIRAGYRRFRTGSHVIFFRLVEGDVEIMRVLHQSMDFGRHL